MRAPSTDALYENKLHDTMMTMMTIFASISFTFVFALIVTNTCFAQDRTTNLELSNTMREPHRLALKHLPNSIQIHDKVISGGQPDGEQAFLELKELGVRSIISVDGAKPDVAIAKKHGLRYVHLPLGYNGIPQERIEELAKAVRDLEGPIYIHCHHGKHRSPAAAAVACISAGLVQPTSGLAILKLAGTSEDYLGLFISVGSALRLPAETIAAARSDFPESAILPPLAESMVELERTHDHLKQFAAAAWQSVPRHSDIDPVHEALLLVEHFAEILRSDVIARQPEGFQKLLRESESDGNILESAIRQWKRSPKSEAIPTSIVEPFNRISRNCVTCHRKYRDPPSESAE